MDNYEAQDVGLQNLLHKYINMDGMRSHILPTKTNCIIYLLNIDTVIFGPFLHHPDDLLHLRIGSVAKQLNHF